MSIEDNKMLARGLVDALNRHDVEAFDDVFADDYFQHAPGAAQGLAGVKGFFRGLFAAFPDVQIIVDDMVAEGDRIVLYGHLTGTHQGEFRGIPPTGKPINVYAMDIWRVENGRLAEHWNVVDNLALMQQLGVLT